MTSRISKIFLLLAVLPLLFGCGIKKRAEAVWEKMPSWNKQSRYPTGITYPPTSKEKTIFKADQALPNCKVFAHLLIWTPAGANGLSIAQAAEKEAAFHGADMLLIGRSRFAKDDKGLRFIYYGPEQPYSCRDNWEGWKFGYEDWINQGNWVSMGYAEWSNADARFNFPVVIQAAFLRCQE